MSRPVNFFCAECGSISQLDYVPSKPPVCPCNDRPMQPGVGDLTQAVQLPASFKPLVEFISEP
jgi:hypothetical protein